MALKEGDVIAGRYVLQRVLGAGGMGTVWLAEHMTLKTPLAIKFIDSALIPRADLRARFIREAQIAARIQSEHVVKVFDHGLTDGDQPYIAMEYLSGISVRDRLTKDGRLSLADTARVVRHVARALMRAHQEGLVHRDVKPENLFIVKNEDEEVVKVLDFGAAKAPDALSVDGVDPTRTGALVGTPYYMSPEQAQGLKTVDTRADLWGLGVVVFECLTGVRPFTGAALGPLVVAIIAGPIPAPSRVAPNAGIPVDVDVWMTRALERDPAKRFASAKEMADAFVIASGMATSEPRSASAIAVPVPVASSSQPLSSDIALAATIATPATIATAPPATSRRLVWVAVALSVVAAAVVAVVLSLR
jgi:serine/threonine protein kinase